MPGISDIFISALLGSSAAITTKSTSTQKIRSLDDMSYVDANYKRKKLRLRCKIKTLLIFLANQVIKIFLEMPANIREHAIQFIKKWADFDYYSH
jgi:hypothetical protein